MITFLNLRDIKMPDDGLVIGAIAVLLLIVGGIGYTAYLIAGFPGVIVAAAAVAVMIWSRRE